MSKKAIRFLLVASIALSLAALSLVGGPARATETLKVLGQIAPAATTGTVTITNASPGVVTFTGNSFANGDMVVFTTSGALPTGLTASTTYFVVNNGTDGSGKFRVSATSGGSAINTSSAGSGTHTVKGYLIAYTVPASTSTVVSTIVAANDSTTTNDTFIVSVHPACAAWARKYQIAPGTASPFSDAIIMTFGITLATTDCVTIYSANGTTVFNIFGSEVQ